MAFLFRRKKSANSAKERLQLVLIHDRTDLTPTELSSLKDEILEVISRHVDIDSNAVQIAVEHDGRRELALTTRQQPCIRAAHAPSHGADAPVALFVVQQRPHTVA